MNCFAYTKKESMMFKKSNVFGIIAILFAALLMFGCKEEDDDGYRYIFTNQSLYSVIIYLEGVDTGGTASLIVSANSDKSINIDDDLAFVTFAVTNATEYPENYFQYFIGMDYFKGRRFIRSEKRIIIHDAVGPFSEGQIHMLYY
jgi:hypothetical protein